jgi:hypothetical protein
MASEKKVRVERRKEVYSPSILWSKLSLAQKFSANSLSRFGYELDFIRVVNGQNIAVLKCHNGLAVITDDGDIDITPDIEVRKSL